MFIYNFFFNKLFKNVKDREGAMIFSIMGAALMWIFIVGRTASGLIEANNPDNCKIESIGDIIVAPFYGIGCNIGKKRFDKSLIIGK